MDSNTTFVWFTKRGYTGKAELSVNLIYLFNLRQDLSYGLRSPRNATRGLQSVLQAYIIKNFVFDRRPKDKKSVPIEQYIRIFFLRRFVFKPYSFEDF